MMRLMQLMGGYYDAGLDFAVRATILLALASVATLFMRRSSASARHLIWSISLVGVLLLPALARTLPLHVDFPITLAVPTEAKTTPLRSDVASPAFAVDTKMHSAQPVLIAMNRDDSPAIASDTPVRQSDIIDWRSLVVAVWVAGFSVCLLPLLLGMISLHALRRGSRPLTEGPAQQLNELAKETLGGRIVVGLMSHTRRMPMTWGIFRPVIVLPSDVMDWSVERRRLVMSHELAHVGRYDCLFQIVGQIVRALCWFNPLAWWALRQLALEQEQACDDCVLNHGANADDYAAELLSVTANVPRFQWDSAVALAMSRATRLERRLEAILDANRNRKPLSMWRSALPLLVLGIVFLGVAATRARVVQAAPPADAQEVAQATGEVKAQQPAAAAVEQPAAKEDSARLEDVLEKIKSYSVLPVDQTSLNRAAIRGMIDSLQDPYSSFLSASEMKEFNVLVEGRLAGIGVALQKTETSIAVMRVIPNSTAWKAGVKPQDEILSVDGHAITEIADAVKAIRGPVGSELTLKLRRRPQEEITLTLKRANVQLPSVKGVSMNEDGTWRYWLDDAQKIGYVQIVDFNAVSLTEFKAALKSLVDQGLKGLVLDLRGNPGGLFPVVIDTAQVFLKDAVVVEVRGRTAEDTKSFKTGAEVLYPELPLVVLIDHKTASAAEVLASALKENKRAVIVGERSFGKGSVQSIFPLGDDGPALRLSTAQMLTASGQPLHRHKDAKVWGVDPNDGYFIPMTPNQRKARLSQSSARDLGPLKLPQPLTVEFARNGLADPALAAAWQAMQSKLTSGEFAKTGSPLAEQQALLVQQAELLKQRDELQQKLQQLNAQLGENVVPTR